MAVEPKKRKYELRRRAEAMADTRQRITEAAVELHGTLGPARTTVSAVAERAGVQRHTVYRHFPTDADLFASCSAHFAESHPGPGLEAWTEIADPSQRLAVALDELYAWYERTGHMWSRVLRDADMIAAVAPNLTPFRAHLDEMARLLAAPWRARGARRRVVAAAARHAVDFWTWHSLVRDGGLARAQAVRLAGAMVEVAAAPAAKP